MIDKPAQFLKGVGPSRSKLLQKLGISTIQDLLSYFPRDYEDRRKLTRIAALVDGEKAVVRGKVEVAEAVKLNFTLSVFKAAISDGSGVAYALFYRKTNPYHKHDVFSSLKKDFAKGSQVVLSGSVEVNFGEKRINVDEYEPAGQENGVSVNFGRIIPVYRITEGIHQKWLRSVTFNALKQHLTEINDIMPAGVLESERLSDIRKAFGSIHFPDSPDEAEAARQRIALNEFLLLETALSLARKSSKGIDKKRRYAIKRSLLTPFKDKLGFEFTNAQKKVINTIFSDMQAQAPMNRLLLGDVGSGKTVVAASAMLLAAENGFQAALLAPTEILAEQHALTLSRLFEGLPVRTALLTGRGTGKKGKQGLYKAIAEGEADIIVGTHAMLEENVKFKNLALAVADEQHRFGVLQREALRKKTPEPDVLVMTATPIPRTLALTVYGELDVSVIDELPPGRKPVETVFIPETAAYEKVIGEVKKGRQAFIVYPLVEESDKLELKAAVKEAETLAASVFKDFRIGLLHGQLPAKEKEKVMMDFRDRKFDILIATTVIEVGIDIPNATVMVIEHSERFGLATLHQLRGRIGRGSEKSCCILTGEHKSEDSRKRLDVMLSTSDGFRIAEEDLKIRGPGEFLGTAQHGAPEFKAGNISRDIKLIEKAKTLAGAIIDKDASLSSEENGALRRSVLSAYAGRFGLSKVG